MLRRELHRRGLRYRVDVAPLQGLRRRADVVFTKRQVAVFVDGCFWHRCPLHGTVPKNNNAWWEAKLGRTAARDRDTDLALVAAGWRVVRVWEHEPLGAAADAVERAVRAGRVSEPVDRAAPARVLARRAAQPVRRGSGTPPASGPSGPSPGA